MLRSNHRSNMSTAHVHVCMYLYIVIYVYIYIYMYVYTDVINVRICICVKYVQTQRFKVHKQAAVTMHTIKSTHTNI